MPSREEKFKEFLQSLSDDKRQQLFNYLTKLTPEERNVAIDTILRRLEKPNKATSNIGRVVQSNTAPKPAPQAPSRISNVAAATAKPAAPKNNAPVNKPAESIVNEVNKPKPSNAEAADFASLKFNDGAQATPKAKETVIKPVRVKANEPDEKASRPQNTKRDLIVVLCVLVVFAAICFGIKLYIGDDDESSKASSESNITTVETTTVLEETTTTVETTMETEPTETTPSPTPAPTNVPIKDEAPDLSDMVIVIDPGHQMESSSETENVASWQNNTKKKATSGTVGVATGIPEYELTLDFSLKLKNYLEQCGATVVLTRVENDVDISNQERAQIAIDSNANLFIRIHADAANDSYTSGVRVFVPDSGDYSSSVVAWGNSLGSKVADSVGLNFIGTKSTGLYTGLNYANSVPAFQISLGLLSNSDDEAVLVDEDNQIEMCAAIADFASELK